MDLEFVEEDPECLIRFPAAHEGFFFKIGRGWEQGPVGSTFQARLDTTVTIRDTVPSAHVACWPTTGKANFLPLVASQKSLGRDLPASWCIKVLSNTGCLTFAVLSNHA